MHKHVARDLEATGLPEAQSPYVAGRHGRVDIAAALGVKKFDHGAGHARPIPLTAVFGIDVELRDHPLQALPVGGLRRDQSHSEPNLTAVRNTPPDVADSFLSAMMLFPEPLPPLIDGYPCRERPAIFGPTDPQLSIWISLRNKTSPDRWN